MWLAQGQLLPLVEAGLLPSLWPVSPSPAGFWAQALFLVLCWLWVLLPLVPLGGSFLALSGFRVGLCWAAPCRSCKWALCRALGSSLQLLPPCHSALHTLVPGLLGPQLHVFSPGAPPGPASAAASGSSAEAGTGLILRTSQMEEEVQRP